MAWRSKPLLRLLVGVPFAVVYGIGMRLAFGMAEGTAAIVGPLSLAFLVLVPLAIGALTVWLAPAEQRTVWSYALGIAAGATAIAAVVAGLIAIEAAICIAMALPILVAMGAIGGAIGCAVARYRRGRSGPTVIGLLLVGPLLAAPVEGRFQPSDSFGEVATSIAIRADAATVWRNVVRVPPIRREERGFSLLFDVFGVPRPIEAMLEREGGGGLRRGRFEDGLTFEETISAWEPERQIAWAIEVGDRAGVPAPWREIGGRFFDVTAAGYRIEPAGDGTVVLHLDSSYRLSTHFNGYGAAWVRWGLGEFQNEVLRVIKARAEAQASGARPPR